MSAETITDIARKLAPRKMRAQWAGAPPQVGHFLLAETGRVARLIIQVRKYQGSASYGGRPYDFVFICQAVPIAEIPFGAVVHCFEYLRSHRRAPR